MSEDFGCIVIVFDPASSAVAKAMKIKKKGRYALKVPISQIATAHLSLNRNIFNKHGIMACLAKVQG
jgi:hypothetical protein